MVAWLGREVQCTSSSINIHDLIHQTLIAAVYNKLDGWQYGMSKTNTMKGNVIQLEHVHV